MSKKKTAKKKPQPRSAAARKPAKARSSRGVGAPPSQGKVQLKPIIVLIERAIVDLKRLPVTDSTGLALKQLETARMAVDDICTAPGGCGPTMEYPPSV